MVSPLAAVACSSAPRAGAIDTKALENAPFVGAWTSDLDAATLTVEPTGLFSIDVPARGETPARSVVGRWNLDDSGGIVTFTNLGATAMCAEVPGSYAFEIVRDTVRFTAVTAGERKSGRIAVEAGLAAHPEAHEAWIRLHLERGRVHNSSGDAPGALPHLRFFSTLQSSGSSGSAPTETTMTN